MGNCFWCMIKPEDHQVILYRENYSQKFWNEDYSMVLVDLVNYKTYKNDLLKVLLLLNDQLPDWDQRPKEFDEIVKRFNSESKCLLFYYKGQCIGWNWFNEKVRFDWVTIDKDLPEDCIYAGGCYVSNKVDRPPDAGVINYNMWVKHCLDLGYNTIYGYCDSWNRNAVRVNVINGFVLEDWYGHITLLR